MRKDFNKQLTERERLGHKMKFGDVRNAKLNKVLDEEMSGGKESIHTRRRHAKGGNGGRKSFNENLNPLKNYLSDNVGRPWDKIYSEITSTFDKRKVINNHILEHLFQYVEREVYIVDGKPCTLNKWRHKSKEYSPITPSKRNDTFYVDPRDGLMKAPKQESHAKRRSREGQEAKAAEERLRRLYARIDEDNHLIRKDGIWWVYTAKEKPPKVMEYSRPYFSLYADSKAWTELYESQPTEEAKKKMLIGRLVDGPMPDKIETPDVPGFYNGSWYSKSARRMIPDNKYFYKRQAASHKQLKAAGVDGMVSEEEPKNMSHREASKYRVKR